MSVTETQLVNRALMEIGEQTVTDIDDTTNSRARKAKLLYQSSRDEVLREYTWNCATKRTTLAQTTNTPSWGFAYEYQLPADFIRFHRMNDFVKHFSIEGDKLLSDDSTISIKYVAKITEVPRMDTLLQNAITLKLAEKLAMALKADRTLSEDMRNRFNDAVARAKITDANEEPMRDLVTSTWLDAREGGAIGPPSTEVD